MWQVLRQRWKSKTYRAAVLLALLSGIEISSGFFAGHVPDAVRPWLVMAWPLLMMLMREVTTASLAEK